MNSRNVIGAVLILGGISLFFLRGTELGPSMIFTYFWPSLFVLPVGLFFHWLYFSLLKGKGAGVLVPGGVLITVAVVCQIAMLFDAWDLVWPGFILAPAVGLFELYWFGGRNKWLLIPIFVLTGISILFFSVFNVGNLIGDLVKRPYTAFILILLGVLLMFTRKKEI